MTDREKMARRKAEARKARERKQRNRRVALTLVLMLAVCAASIGGTIAWLTATTAPVVNTFTPSDIKITLTETKTDFKMVPGTEIDKDPKVTVKEGSEACWLFVKVEESTNPKLDEYITYTVADGWTQLKDASDKEVEGVFFRKLENPVTTDVSYNVLDANKVAVKDTVNEAMMEAITGNDSDGNAKPQPTLTFTAYAIQYVGHEPVAPVTNATTMTAAYDAWTEISK